MDRRTFFVAVGGLVATTAVARAQMANPPVLGDALGLGGDALGAGLAVPGEILGIGGDPGDGFRAADLMGGEVSIETSKLALQRARSQAVRDFAQLEINEQLSIAAALGAAPGSVPLRPDQQLMVANLAATRPAAFDHAYIMGQIKGHNELLAVNTQASQAAASDAVRRVATVAIPTIQTHLAILHRLRAGLPAV